uniref:CSON006124 protein n=1 Tax=Culicoides sonorensis TaxID=179676 RepID=A0A336MRX3_CULSO
MFELVNKSAIVLGGAGGIGKEICVQLVNRGLKKLAIIDVVEEALCKDLFKNLDSYTYKQCSVTDEPKLREYMTSLKSSMGGLDLVVNSAGILDEQSPKRTIDINYGGVVNSTLIGIELMRKDRPGNKGGVIVNISSISALGGHFWLPIYAGTKHAVLGFTRSLVNKKFFEKTGVSFMAICPGVTETPLAVVDAFCGRHQFQDMKDEVKRILDSFPSQGVECVGKCVLEALDDGENGSTWQCENNRIEKLKIIDYPKFA